ncbi:MAG TPA: hypothetical protein VFW07_06915 [Parafilimonas sp.]|nr:hypothetical protein [Parafilimonas sp.]
MSYNLEFALRVAYDINKAFAWYEKQKPGLGAEFIIEIEDCYKNPNFSPKLIRILQNKGGV